MVPLARHAVEEHWLLRIGRPRDEENFLATKPAAAASEQAFRRQACGLSRAKVE